jgi:hypothetical protein
MMSPALNELRDAYVAELRESKAAAEAWWSELEKAHSEKPSGAPPTELWPMGPASHPWVIAIYRKYYFLALQLKRQIEQGDVALVQTAPEEADWGSEEAPDSPLTWVEPKVFVLDLLSGGDTHDLYEFLLSLIFVPIGLKADEPV